MQHLISQIHESLHGTAKLCLPHTPLLRNFIDGRIGASFHTTKIKSHSSKHLYTRVRAGLPIFHILFGWLHLQIAGVRGERRAIPASIYATISLADPTLVIPALLLQEIF